MSHTLPSIAIVPLTGHGACRSTILHSWQDRGCQFVPQSTASHIYATYLIATGGSSSYECGEGREKRTCNISCFFYSCPLYSLFDATTATIDFVLFQDTLLPSYNYLSSLFTSALHYAFTNVAIRLQGAIRYDAV